MRVEAGRGAQDGVMGAGQEAKDGLVLRMGLRVGLRMEAWK